ncbi:hypothetical protein RI065_08555 [Mycoplasmatota bacterium zrk1]
MDLKVNRLDITIDLLTKKFFDIDQLFHRFILKELVSPIDIIFHKSDGYLSRLEKRILQFGLGRKDAKRELISISDKSISLPGSQYSIFASTWYRFYTSVSQGRTRSLLKHLINNGIENLHITSNELLNWLVTFIDVDTNKIWSPWRDMVETENKLILDIDNRFRR